MTPNAPSGGRFLGLNRAICPIGTLFSRVFWALCPTGCAGPSFMTESQKVLLIWLNERPGNQSLSQLVGLLSDLPQTLLNAQHIAQAISGAGNHCVPAAEGEPDVAAICTLPVTYATSVSGDVH